MSVIATGDECSECSTQPDPVSRGVASLPGPERPRCGASLVRLAFRRSDSYLKRTKITGFRLDGRSYFPARCPMRFPVFPVLAALALTWGGESASLGAQQPAEPSSAGLTRDLSLAFRFGTLGFGPQLSKLLTGHVAARIGANFFSYSTTKTQSDIA